MIGLTTTLLLALATGSMAEPVPEPIAAPVPQDGPINNDCLVNARFLDVWHEAGMTGRRIDFSSENTPVERFCDYFADCKLY
ncbi:hypothetical protein BDV19DRAFT_392856 [Aspergillus venezuelensis]